jgi:nucleoid-associated protein YgaU
MAYGSDPAVMVAVSALVAALLARPVGRALAGTARAVGRAGRTGGRLLAGAATRRAALGALGSGALLATAGPTAALPAAAPATAVGPAAGHVDEGVAAGGPSPQAPVDRAGPLALYVVVPGDCLWDIARRHLPPGAGDAEVADAWPRWWAANRTTIGPDPHLIHPGTRLVVPPRFRSTGTSTTAAPAAASFDPDRR